MSKARHTPGPWVWNEHYGYWTLEAESGKRICDDGSAADEYSKTIDPDGDEEERANAKLIAAAPELLAACKAQELAEQLHEECGECEGDGDWAECETCSNYFGKAIDLRRAAIAKAEAK